MSFPKALAILPGARRKRTGHRFHYHTPCAQKSSSNDFPEESLQSFAARPTTLPNGSGTYDAVPERLQYNKNFIRSEMSTKPDVFIIESLDPDDEGNGRFEGVFLSQMLRLHGKSPKYRYVRTRSEFTKAIKAFGASRYRYLHISSHADHDGLYTTNKEFIDHAALATMLRPHINGRRIFASACEIATVDMARSVIPGSECISIVGPTKKILFTEAAVVWASIYHLVFTHDARSIRGEVLKEKLLKVCEIFNVKFAYYSRSTRVTRGYTRNLLDVT